MCVGGGGGGRGACMHICAYICVGVGACGCGCLAKCIFTFVSMVVTTANQTRLHMSFGLKHMTHLRLKTKEI